MWPRFPLSPPPHLLDMICSQRCPRTWAFCYINPSLILLNESSAAGLVLASPRSSTSNVLPSCDGPLHECVNATRISMTTGHFPVAEVSVRGILREAGGRTGFRSITNSQSNSETAVHLNGMFPDCRRTCEIPPHRVGTGFELSTLGCLGFCSSVSILNTMCCDYLHSVTHPNFVPKELRQKVCPQCSTAWRTKTWPCEPGQAGSLRVTGKHSHCAESLWWHGVISFRWGPLVGGAVRGESPPDGYWTVKPCVQGNEFGTPPLEA